MQRHNHTKTRTYTQILQTQRHTHTKYKTSQKQKGPSQAHNNHSDIHTKTLSLYFGCRTAPRHSRALHRGVRCSARRTSGASPQTLPRPCLLTSVPLPSPRPPSPSGRSRVMVSARLGSAGPSPLICRARGGEATLTLYLACRADGQIGRQ